ncbi:MAG: polysaccharide deacetylase family protein [Marinoscillum sp.]
MKSISLVVSIIFCLGCNRAGSNNSSSEEVNQSKEVVCFVYHRFGDDRFPSTNVSLNDFKAHLSYLKENEFRVLTFDAALDYLKSDDRAQKTAVITIDDGYDSFYKNGLPLLEQFGFPATLFINTETVGGSDYMDWEDLKDAQSRKIEIGNHTHSHAYFLNQPESERYENFKSELQLTQKLIRENLGTTPTTFAYPYGELDEQMKEIVKSVGFKGAAAQNSGVIHSASDLLRCPRFPMSEFYSAPDKFESKANMHSLNILEEKPYSFIKPANTDKPKLQLIVKNADLNLGSINCFIQGSECNISRETIDEETSQITIMPQSAITDRRRFLYTITLQDKSGQWYWFSHLWIDSSK